MNVLITGGAGFIGSHLTDHLVRQGHRVRLLDGLDPQVHRAKSWPDYINPKAEKIQGDVCNRQSLLSSLEKMDAVVHFAAAVGVGQSMYQVEHYVRANVLGTAVLWDVLANEKHTVRKVVAASSMSAYGEGLYECSSCGKVRGSPRPEDQLKKKQWELLCPRCGQGLKPVPTPESEPFHCHSVYALSKRDQEELCLMLGRVYGISTTALRFFNVYGPRQSLSNPYTGVAAIFLSRIKNSQPPLVYEDGNQSRDFVSVYDVARAVELSLTREEADFETFNVGSGRPVAICEVARVLGEAMKSTVRPKVLETFRVGDIRHCSADTSKIQARLGWRPTVSLEDGFRDLCQWAQTAQAQDFFQAAEEALQKRGLLR